MGITRNVPRANRSATAAPGVTNDISEGYVVGSPWNDVTNDLSYECLDNTDGAAVWQKRIKGPPPDEITATSEGVAASLFTVNTEVTTNGDSDLDDVTLANGVSGQVKRIYCVVETVGADTWKITPATMAGGTQITFATVGEGCVLVYADSEGWAVVANNGGTIA